MTSRQKPPAPDGPVTPVRGSSAAGGADPSAGPGGSSVRRAVTLGSVGADPGAMLAPATPPSANGARGEREGTGQPRPDTPDTPEILGTPGTPGTSAGGTASASTRPDAVGAEPEAEVGAEGETRTAASAARAPEPEAASAGGRPRTASASASASASSATAAAAPDAEAAVSMGEAVGGGDARGGDEPPSGNPKKPLLAAAGIAGVVLLVVPLLIWATDDSEKKDKVSVAVRSDTVLDEELPEAPKGAYAPAEPTAEPSSPKPSAKAKAKPEVKVAAPSPEPTPEQSVQVKKKDKDSGKPVEQEAPKPAPNTAALAVQRLATTSPGRHVCYRAYVKGIGWQAPVCDGVVAGAQASGRPIKALNIAVSGTNGTSANEFIQKAGWPTKWEGVANGVDLTIGSARQDAPNMAGLAISVGDGAVCQNTRVHDGGWLGLGCNKPGGYIFGGTLDESRWLEAVRLAV